MHSPSLRSTHHEPKKFIMTISLKLTAKGQLTLRKEHLHHLGISAGEYIQIIKLPDSSLKITAMPKKISINHVAGLLAHQVNKPFSIEEINQAISDAYVSSGCSGLISTSKK